MEDEILRLMRRGSVWDLDDEMSEAGAAAGIRTVRLGHRMTARGSEILFQFVVGMPWLEQPQAEQLLRDMAKACAVLYVGVQWRVRPDPDVNIQSGVLTVCWDSCVEIVADYNESHVFGAAVLCCALPIIARGRRFVQSMDLNAVPPSAR